MKSLKDKEKKWYPVSRLDKEMPQNVIYIDKSHIFSDDIKEAVLEFKDEILCMKDEIGTSAKIHIYNMIDKWLGDWEE